MIEFFRGTVTPRDWAMSGGIVGVAALLCIVFYILIYNRALSENQRVLAQDAEVRSELAKAQEIEKNIDALRNQAGKMQELVTQFERRLPESAEIPMLLKDFEGFAKEIGMRVQLSMLPRVTDDKKETIPYSVSAEGDFHQIVTFINRLERFQRYLKVSDLVIGEEKDGIAKATFTLSTFRFIQKSDEEAAKDDKKADEKTAEKPAEKAEEKKAS